MKAKDPEIKEMLTSFRKAKELFTERGDLEKVREIEGCVSQFQSLGY